MKWNRVTLLLDDPLKEAIEQYQEEHGHSNFSEAQRAILSEHLGVEFVPTLTESRTAPRQGKYNSTEVRDKVYKFLPASSQYTYTEISKSLGYHRAMLKRLVRNYPEYFEEYEQGGTLYVQKVTRRERSKREEQPKRKIKKGSIPQVRKALWKDWQVYARDPRLLVQDIYDLLEDNSDEQAEEMWNWFRQRVIDEGSMLTKFWEGRFEEFYEKAFSEEEKMGPELLFHVEYVRSRDFFNEYVKNIQLPHTVILEYLEEYIDENEVGAIITAEELMHEYLNGLSQWYRDQGLENQANEFAQQAEEYPKGGE